MLTNSESRGLAAADQNLEMVEQSLAKVIELLATQGVPNPAGFILNHLIDLSNETAEKVQASGGFDPLDAIEVGVQLAGTAVLIKSILERISEIREARRGDQ